MWLVNGPPKAGTHAVMHVLAGLGLERTPGIVRAFLRSEGPHTSKGSDDETPSLQDVQAMPDNRFIHAHIHDGIELDCRMVFVIRDPRDIAVSYSRWNRCSPSLDTVIRRGYRRRQPLVASVRRYLGWLQRADLAIKFERLCAEPEAATRDIAEAVGMPYREDAARRIGRIVEPLYDDPVKETLTKARSEWRAWWTPEAEQVWREAGGPELVAELGYAPD